ncbi:hypothetical protein ACDT10_08955 [Mycobacterium intracellulare]|uniref:hypothetical protein n=1 Tax=Mycobacterium intracellulare TaxID=1767 RepID=UPI003556B10C
MAKFTENAGAQPWPTKHVCDDGKTRSLATFIAAQWAEHPEVREGRPGGHPSGSDQAGAYVWQAHRLRVATSLGRKDYVLKTISAMSGRRVPRKGPLG